MKTFLYLLFINSCFSQEKVYFPDYENYSMIPSLFPITNPKISTSVKTNFILLNDDLNENKPLESTIKPTVDSSHETTLVTTSEIVIKKDIARNYLRNNIIQIKDNNYTNNFDETMNPISTILYFVLSYIICTCVILIIMSLCQLRKKSNE